MCTVIYYSFDCGHYITRCRSRCGGTKVKVRPDKRKAACSALGYITIKRSLPCSVCSREVWTSRWQSRLERAERFYNGMVERKLPGAEHVSHLVQQLNKDYDFETWKLKDTLPPDEREKPKRVVPAATSWSKPPSSPLKREVLPEEVVLPVVPEAVDYGDDDDYVRSTDPLHPVSTNYEIISAGIDDAYLETLLAGDTGEIAGDEQDEHVSFGTAWDWNDEAQDPTDSVEEAASGFNSKCLDPSNPTRSNPHHLRTHRDERSNNAQRAAAEHMAPNSR